MNSVYSEFGNRVGDIQSPGSGVTGSCELSGSVTGNRTWVLYRCNVTSLPFSGPKNSYLNILCEFANSKTHCNFYILCIYFTSSHTYRTIQNVRGLQKTWMIDS